jgi:hypothetical protein
MSGSSFSIIDILPLLGIALFGFTGFLMAKTKLPKIKARIISISLLASGLAMLFSYLYLLAPRYRNAYSVTEISFFKSPKGNFLLVQHNATVPSNLSVSYSRLSVVNAETGKIIHTVVAGPTRGNDKELFLLLVTDDKIWYTSYKIGLHARDPYTGKILLKEKDIIKKYPQLNSSTKVQVKTVDGYVFESKPPDFRLTMISFPPNQLNSALSWIKQLDEDEPYKYKEANQQWMYNQDTSYIPLAMDDEMAILDERNALSFVRNGAEDRDIKQLMHFHKVRSYSWEKDTSINKELDLRKPFIIENYLLKGRKSLLVGYYGFNEKRKLVFLMSRIDLAGNIIWTLKEDDLGGEPNIFSLNNGILYLAVKGTVVAVDPYKGIKKWTARF